MNANFQALIDSRASHQMRLERRVIELMADGRERTTADIATSLKVNHDSVVTVMRRLHIAEAVTAELVDHVGIWKKA